MSRLFKQHHTTFKFKCFQGFPAPKNSWSNIKKSLINQKFHDPSAVPPRTPWGASRNNWITQDFNFLHTFKNVLFFCTLCMQFLSLFIAPLLNVFCMITGAVVFNSLYFIVCVLSCTCKLLLDVWMSFGINKVNMYNWHKTSFLGDFWILLICSNLLNIMYNDFSATRADKTLSYCRVELWLSVSSHHRPADSLFIYINNMNTSSGVANSSDRFYWWRLAKHSSHAGCLKITLLPYTTQHSTAGPSDRSGSSTRVSRQRVHRSPCSTFCCPTTKGIYCRGV